MTTQTKWYVDEPQFRYTLEVIAGSVQITIWGTGPQAQEVANLCAAAPDLLEACEAARSILWMAERYAEAGGQYGPERRDYDEAAAILIAALAKAKGEQ